MKYWLVQQINEIWKSGNLNNKLKRIKVIEILKPNKPAETENLRPIALVSVILKIINIKVRFNLNFMLEINNCLLGNSFGFRKNY